MILAPITDRRLRNAVRRAALPEEDVFHRSEIVRRALRLGYPRLLLCLAEDQDLVRSEFLSGDSRVPVLAVRTSTLRRWEETWETDGLAVSRIDDSAFRLRRLMAQTAGETDWVEGVLSDLSHTLGGRLPPQLRGFARRTMEFPGWYSSVSALGYTVGLSPGALKERFSRRGLPSPALYLRWFRLLTVAKILSDPRETTLTASFRLGFASDGNFCRWIRRTSGLAPSSLRDWNGRLLLLVRLAEECFPGESLQRWESLGGLFLRQVA